MIPTRSTAAGFFPPVLCACALAGCAEPPFELRTPVEVVSPAGPGSAQPHLATGADGTAVLSWLEPQGEDYVLRFSTLANGAWTRTGTVAAGSDWFVNWADFPSVVPMGGGLWAAHWLVNQEDAYGYDVVFSTSRDEGRTWAEPAALHLDGTPTEHGFVTLFPWREGVGAVWLDGRNMVQDGEVLFENDAGEPLGMSLRYSLFTPDGQRLLTEELDGLVCDCCQTDVALSGDDALLVYRDRTVEEVRDIALSRLSADGWHAPRVLETDNWVIGGCPINGPAIDVRGEHVAVAWFSAVNNEPVVHVASSGDRGATFSDSAEIDSAGSFGHVDVAVLETGQTVVSWLRSRGEGLGLMMRVLEPSGELGEPMTVAEIDAARPLDFPQMVYTGSRLVFAWTDAAEAEQVRTAVVELARP